MLDFFGERMVLVALGLEDPGLRGRPDYLGFIVQDSEDAGWLWAAGGGGDAEVEGSWSTVLSLSVQDQGANDGGGRVKEASVFAMSDCSLNGTGILFSSPAQPALKGHCVGAVVVCSW
jgi:hypothetical protein